MTGNNKTLKLTPVILLAIALLTLNACSVFKRNRRVNAAQGTENIEGEFSHYVYSSQNKTSNTIIMILSGDGGWMEFNDALAQHFSKAGYNTLGINSRNYFWQRRTPQETTNFLVGVLKKYQLIWKNKEVVLIGYSFGADVIPFIYNRLPKKNQRQVKAIHLLSPFKTTDFRVKVSDLINLADDNKTFSVEQELIKIKIPIICFYGEEETSKPLENLKMKNLLHKKLKGGHKYINAYETIVSSVKASLLSVENNNFAFAQ